MKKRQYSLTAKERKELRNKETAKNKRNIDTTPIDGDDAAVSSETKDKKKFLFWVIPVSVIAAALIIAASILLPMSCSNYNLIYKDIKNPVARMELSNGMVLEFELYEDDCPAAATNFIYLANNKFFDDTIIFDNQQGWVRFGDYVTMTKLKSTYNKENKKYLDSLPGIYENHATNPLGYRLKADKSDDAKRINEEGMLTFDYRNSSCRFFISSRKDCQTWLGGTNYTPTVVGRYLNDTTLSHIKAIADMENDEDSPNNVWRNPLPIITVKKVRVYNLNKEKWKNFHFEDYMEDKAGGGANDMTSGWLSD